MAVTAEQLTMSDEPTMSDVNETRTYRKQHPAIAFRAFALLGYNTGPADHAAVRDPEHPDWWFGFQTPLQRVVAKEPDVLD